MQRVCVCIQISAYNMLIYCINLYCVICIVFVVALCDCLLVLLPFLLLFSSSPLLSNHFQSKSAKKKYLLCSFTVIALLFFRLGKIISNVVGLFLQLFFMLLSFIGFLFTHIKAKLCVCECMYNAFERLNIYLFYIFFLFSVHHIFRIEMKLLGDNMSN